MVEAMVKVAADNDISSIHVTFCLREQWDALGKLGFLKRQHYSSTGTTMATRPSTISWRR